MNKIRNATVAALALLFLLAPAACMSERRPGENGAGTPPEQPELPTEQTESPEPSATPTASEPEGADAPDRQSERLSEAQVQRAIANYNAFQKKFFSSGFDCSGDPLDVAFQYGKELERAALDQFPISEDDEEAYGREFYESISQEFTLLTGDRRLDRIQRVARKLLPYRERKGIAYDFYLVDHDMVNAFTTVGGHIYVTTGLLDFIGGDDDQLANVLGHEIAHSDKKHCVRTVQKLVLANQFLGAEIGGIAANINMMLSAPFGQTDEYESDRVGASMADRAGFDPYGAVRFFNKLAENEGEYNAIDKMLRTHPYSDQRVACLKQYIGDELNK